jgi:hypothetical protein
MNEKDSSSSVAHVIVLLAGTMVCVSVGVMADDLQFTDVTDASGIDFSVETPSKQMLNNSHFYGGIGIADFDGNGTLDLFFSGIGSTNDTLYLNDGTGSFTDVSAAWGLDDLHFSCGVGAGDFDNDGWIDLAVASAGDASIPGGSPGGYRLYRNLGGTGFEDVATSAGVNNVAPGSVQHPTFASAGDFNADGLIDLLYGSWQVFAEGNRFYLNDGDNTFTDVTHTLDFHDEVRQAKGFSANVIDMDGDLNPDIVWVADFGRSAYFRNDGDNTFTNLTPANGTGIDSSGMGSAILDFNHDGTLDWFVGCIWFDEKPTNFNGNTMYMQYADHQYINMAASFGLNDSGWSWSCSAVDLDHDGFQEIVIGNGIQNRVEFRDEPETILSKDSLNGNYYNVTSESGLDLACQSTSSGSFDMDGDGDMDLVFYCNDGSVHLYRNDSPNLGSWLQVTLGGDPENRIPNNGFNTRVEARVGSTTHVRYMDGNPSYSASGPLMLHFGLGDAEVIDELTIKWINGEVDVLSDVPVNQLIHIDPDSGGGDPVAGDLDGNGVVSGTDLAIVLAGWGQCHPPPQECIADINGDGFVGGVDIGIVLGNWTIP